MLKLYYARPSVYARPVWLALIEKQLSFELAPVDLSGKQFEPEFLAVNPFGHVPVLEDGDLRVIESMAILDYLEARYSDIALLPRDATALARVRMVQMLTLNELLPGVFKLLIDNERSDRKSAEIEYAQLRVRNTLSFLENLLGDGCYFAGEQFTLAEIVAGTVVHRVPDLGVALADYPRLSHWSKQLLARPAWQQIALSAEEWNTFKRRMRVIPKIWQRRRHQRMTALSQQSLTM
ncbi:MULTISPECIES: glutathione S-transferase family protein [Cyanophyceae]|uniref:Glutathione S-transferase family protein n=1 Tax=Leptolyngbya subtilissima DQ-A4 TaxID=2933933 RepID=A0ABV0K0A8_9CYAN|nr:glutathione S-transferase family protein [Nodosilinea sp. FACHB-141]MBD2110942.1 glutathione S-transferase family protein [Nodosilinea sp. FACHB-141]